MHDKMIFQILESERLVPYIGGFWFVLMISSDICKYLAVMALSFQAPLWIGALFILKLKM